MSETTRFAGIRLCLETPPFGAVQGVKPPAARPLAYHLLGALNPLPS